jgi:hypothetical protein
MYTMQWKTRPTCHTLSTLSPRVTIDYTYLTWSTYSNILRSHQQQWIEPLFLRKRAPDTTHNTMADWSVGLYPPEPAIKAVGVKPPSIDGMLLSLLGPYHQHVIGTFNTCSRGPTHWSLTNTGGGYNLGDAILPHYTPRPSQPTVLHFPPKGPAQSPV